MLQIRDNDHTGGLYCLFEYLGRIWYADLSNTIDGEPEVMIFYVNNAIIDYTKPIYEAHPRKITERTLRFHITKFKQIYRP